MKNIFRCIVSLIAVAFLATGIFAQCGDPIVRAQKKAFRAVSAETRVEVMKVHIGELLQNPLISRKQYSLLRRAYAMIDTRLFEQNGPKLDARLLTEADRLFGDTDMFARLQPGAAALLYSKASKIEIAVDDGGGGGKPDCECSGSYCSGNRNCERDGVFECAVTWFGCGFLWLGSCNGLCGAAIIIT